MGDFAEIVFGVIMDSSLPVPDQPESSSSTHPYFDQSDLDILFETRNLRLKLLRNLTKNGALPECKTEKVIVAQFLADAEKEVMNRAKLKAAKDQNETLADRSKMVAEILKGYRIKESEPAKPEERVLPPDITPANVVPGEMEVGYIPISPDRFLSP